jgi:hypothetical protein
VLADVFANVIGNSIIDSISSIGAGARKEAEITLEVVDEQPGSAKLAGQASQEAAMAGDSWWAVGPDGRLNYSEALDYLESFRVYDDESPFAIANNRLIDRSATLLSFARTSPMPGSAAKSSSPAMC